MSMSHLNGTSGTCMRATCYCELSRTSFVVLDEDLGEVYSRNSLVLFIVFKLNSKM